MTKGPLIKGYCPGALRPMMSGDGLVVRLRPFNGRLTQAQAAGIASAARTYGNGLIDLSSRGNLQVRGIPEDRLDALITALRPLSLIDADVVTETRRNILVTPFWVRGDDTETLAFELTNALRDPGAPDLPGKFGFAVDTGPLPVLQQASADIRLERGRDGNLLLCAQGSAFAKRVTLRTAVPQALSLAHWFAALGPGHSRMGKVLHAGTPLPAGFDVPRQALAFVPQPGVRECGLLVGVAFGQMTADLLTALSGLGPLRMTPWRMILIEGLRAFPQIEGVLTQADDPLLRINACTGSPGCAQALAETRHLARMLAPVLTPEQSLHVSGCAKGCAHPGAAALTVTATSDGLTLIRGGRASDAPSLTHLTPQDLIKAI